MSEQARQPGWYDDPFGTGPDDRRYWDGDTWLAVTQTQQAAFDAPGAPPQPQATQPPEAFQGQPYAGQPYGHEPEQQRGGWGERLSAGWGAPAADGDRDRTPDGAVLASWRRRWGAYAIDWIVIQAFTLVLAAALGLIASADRIFQPLLEADPSQDTAAASQAMQDAYVQYLTENSGGILALTVLSLLASGVYHVVLVATRGRTIGKRMVGIRVRLREREGLPIWRASLSRWLLHYALPSLLGGVPGLGFLALAFPIVDGLWPVWDARRQAIHDKVAKTAVVHG